MTARESTFTDLYLAILLLFVLIYSNSIALGQDLGDTSTFSELKLYHNSKFSFSLQIPSDWDVTDEKNGIKVNKEKDVTFVDLSVHDLSSDDLNSYVTDTINKRKEGRDDFKLLQLNETTISGIPALKATYTFKSDPDKENMRKVLRYWTSNHDKLYSIGYVSDIENYDSYFSTAQKIIESLQIDGSNVNAKGGNLDSENMNSTGGDTDSRNDGSEIINESATEQQERVNEEKAGQLLCSKLLEKCNLPSAERLSENLQANATALSEISENNDTGVTLQQENATEVQTDLGDFQIYENSTLGVRTLYPVGWMETEKNSDRYSLISFLSPENSTDKAQERLIIRINNQPSDMSLDEYNKNVIETLQRNANFTIIESNSTLLSGNPGYGITGILMNGDQNVNVLDKWTIKDGIVYRIAFYSEDGNSSNIPMAKEIFNSFRIK